MRGLLQMKRIYGIILLLAFCFSASFRASAQSVADLTREAEEAKNPFNKYDYVGLAEYGVVIVEKDGSYGLVTEGDASPVTEGLVYSSLSYIGGGLFKGEKGGKYGCLASSGTEVVPFVYDKLGSFENGIALAKRSGKLGYVTEGGREVVPCVYDNIGPFLSGKAKVSRFGKYGIIDRNGNELVKCLYSAIGPANTDGLAWVMLGGMHGLLNTGNGQAVLPCAISEAYVYDGQEQRSVDFNSAPEISAYEVVYVKDQNQWGLINGEAKTIVRCSYDFISMFDNGLAWTMNGGRYGVIDKDGCERQPCRFDAVEYRSADGVATKFDGSASQVDFHDRMAYVKAHGKTGVMNHDATILVEPMYDSIELPRDSMFRVCLGGRYGYLDSNGKVAITCMYPSATDFSEGLAAVKKPGDDERFYFIDKTGKEVFKKKVDRVGLFSDGKCQVWIVKKNKTYFIDKEGKKWKEKKDKDKPETDSSPDGKDKESDDDGDDELYSSSGNGSGENITEVNVAQTQTLCGDKCTNKS